MRPGLMLLVLATVSGAQAGAWLQPPGKAYLRLSGGWLETDSRFDASGHAVPFDDFGGFRDTTYRDLESILYMEVGVHPRLTVLGTALAKSLRASQEAAVYRTRGLSDVMVGLKTRLWKGLWHVGSLSAEWWLPTGYEPDHYPALGSGTRTLRLGAHAGASAGKVWANADVIYGFRQTPFRNQLWGILSGGYALSSRLAARGSVGVLSPLGKTKQIPEALFDPATVDARGVEAAATLSWGVGAWALEGEVRGPLQGENILNGTRVALAVATRSNVRLWGEDPPRGPWGMQP